MSTFNALSSHYEVRVPTGNIRKLNIPGFSDPVFKKLTNTNPLITQTGYANATEASSIRSGAGDPNVLCTVNTITQGEFTNCYKQTAMCRGVQSSGNNKIVSYTVQWEQAVAS